MFSLSCALFYGRPSSHLFVKCSGDVHVHLLLFDLNVIWEAGYVLVGCSLLMQFCMFVALYVFLHICIFFVCIYVCMYVCR